MPTLPPRRNTLPGRDSPWLFDTSALSFTNPNRPPPNRSIDWMSICRRTNGSLWNSCCGCCCRASERCSVAIHTLNAGNDRRSSRDRSGVLLIGNCDPGNVKVDMAARSSRVAARKLKCCAARRSRGIMDLKRGYVGCSKPFNTSKWFLYLLDDGWIGVAR